MKIPALVLGVALACLSGSAADHYVDEAPLPEKWPRPGPYGEVVAKTYPAYRGAFTEGRGETVSFFTLFTHIKRHDIPMTSPVEIVLGVRSGTLDQEGMAFLYRSPETGATGADGSKVEVRDVAESEALSYAWRGEDSDENRAVARKSLEAALDSRDLEAAGFRLFGYNGPSTPEANRTWELQALLK